MPTDENKTKAGKPNISVKSDAPAQDAHTKEAEKTDTGKTDDNVVLVNGQWLPVPPYGGMGPCGYGC